MTKSHALCIVLLCFLIVACAAPLRTLSQQELINEYDRFVEDYEAELRDSSEKTVRRIFQEYNQSPSEQSFDVLVLSGGGALGAFGAGFLKGWGEIQSGEFVRPEFDSVSGISTGALIAPFAFVGNEKAYDTIVELYSNPQEDLIVARAIVGLLTGNSSYYDATQLHRRIRRSISPDLVEQISKGGAQSKVLLVGATNLDYGQMRVWDLANIPDGFDVSAAQENIAQKLIASSAIPAAFPPVNIDDFLYVDGGAAMQVVSGIDDRQWLYESNPERLGFVLPERPVKIRIWVVVNNKLVMDPEVTIPIWSSIATRSLISLMRGSTLQTIQDIETYAELINKQPLFDVKMRYVAIPQDYEIMDTVNMFDKDKMRALVELGEKMGSDTNSWKTRALRPGAPFPKNGQ